MIAALAAFAAAFALNLGCAYPAIAPRDAADMAAAAYTLGVAHPPGYPLYSVLGRAWLVLFPWGAEAYRLNALSAAAGAAAAALLFVWVRRRAGAVGAAAAAAAWALSAPLWKFSTLSEKYSLHALFAVALLLLAEGERESVHARARLSGLLAGLALVNHQTILLWLPAVLWLWRAEAARTGARPERLLASAAAPFAAGLALNLFLWVRLGSFAEAFAVATRRRYGAGTLSAGLARPLTPESVGAAIAFFFRALVDALSWPAAALAAVGAAVAWSRERVRAGALLVGLACAGPLFVALARVDPADWVARSILEPAFLLPALAAAAFVGDAVGALSRRSAALGAAVAVSVAIVPARGAWGEHRDDYLAYDYLRDLRRAVPPGGALLAGGDTASFGLRWLELTNPESPARVVTPAELGGAAEWRAATADRRDAFVAGVGIEELRALGIGAAGTPASPEGLVLRVGALPPTPSAPTVLRRARAWERGESYARDARLSRAYAAWLAARLLEGQGRTAPETLDLTAASDDPDDYRLN